MPSESEYVPRRRAIDLERPSPSASTVGHASVTVSGASTSTSTTAGHAGAVTRTRSDRRRQAAATTTASSPASSSRNIDESRTSSSTHGNPTKNTTKTTASAAASKSADVASARQHRSSPSDPSRLAPEDAFYANSPPRRERRHSPLGLGAVDGNGAVGGAGGVGGVSAGPGGAAGGAGGATLGFRKARRESERGRSGSRRRRGVWKKLLWVKQSYPDNYTDEETFLDHYQQNPSFRPYEFWSLVSDLTVIVQHVCSVTIFLCCFTAIFREQISPLSVVEGASLATVLGWVIWDFWVGGERETVEGVRQQEQQDTDDSHRSSVEVPILGQATRSDAGSTVDLNAVHNGTSGSSSPIRIAASMAASNTTANSADDPLGLGLRIPNALDHNVNSSSRSSVVNGSNPGDDNYTVLVASPSGHPTGAPTFANYSSFPPYKSGASYLSPRNQQRLATLKSAGLIFCALLGLSPILKSLTQAWASDSIWAMACGLVCINVFFYDYSGGQTKLPASFSMNAAVMASTVLASRLPSTTHVFSLSLFSIEVFALFPIFRRYLRLVSWKGHVTLTVLLVMGAGGSVGLTMASRPGWGAALGGVVLGDVLTMLAMGVTSWWLIGLQKYKNEIHGPWDPARPVVRRRWD